MAPFLASVVSLHRPVSLSLILSLRSIKSRLPVTFKCLYNAASLPRFTFWFSRKVDVTSVVASSINDVSSILLVFGVL